MIGDSEAAVDLLRQCGIVEPITVGLVLGTGLSVIADALEGAIVVPYADLPGFPKPTVSGHVGQLALGVWEGVRIAVFEGRSHYYETGDARGMAVPLAALKALGAHSVILTNSAGSLHLDWHPGTIAVISDHINFAGVNPLIGATSDSRFVNLSEAYDRRLRIRMRKAAQSAGANALKEGVYMWFSGPSFETPAEVKMAKSLGADLVGMSTVPEVILARQLELRVVALSVVTNFGTGLHSGNPTHAETKIVARSGSIALRRILRAYLRDEHG